MEFRKAERKKSKARIALAGPSGSGKTYSALLLAAGLGGKIAFIDTEQGSGDLYSHLFDYDILNITAPYEVEKYIQAIKLAEQVGYDTIIIDSLTHAWAGQGGLLDLQSKITDSGRFNSYTAWRMVTPKHNTLVETILTSPCHIIATIRSKTAYLQQSNNGKVEIKKAGMEPVQRDGMEYEFTIFFDLSIDHIANASKDRTSLFDGKFFTITKETGEKLMSWLNEGKETTIVNNPQPTIAPAPETTNIKENTKNKADIAAEILRSASNIDELRKSWEHLQKNVAYLSMTDEEKNRLKTIKEEMKIMLKDNHKSLVNT